MSGHISALHEPAPAMAPVRVAAPLLRILSREEAKEHVRVEAEVTENDALIDALILSVEQHLDGAAGILRRALITQTWEARWRAWAWRMPLPLAPVQSVESISYVDAAGAVQELAEGWRLQAGAGEPYVEIDQNTTWPELARRDDAVTVRFVAGYGASPMQVPGPIRRAALILLGSLYEHREEVMMGATPQVLPVGAKALLAPYRRAAI